MKTFSEAKSNQHDQAAQGRSPARRLVFYLVAAAIPVVALLAAELLLRAAGVTNDERAPFIAVPGHSDYLVANPGYVGRYFSGFTPGLAFTPFSRQKPPGAFRVVVLGGSSAAGFPYRFNFSFPAFLQAQLEAQALGQRIEVVNLGMSAVNSYTLRDLARHVADIEPNAVVIYAGHNEFYGAFGVGSSIGRAANKAWLKRLVLFLKRSALYLALEGLITPDAPEAPSDRTLMARVVRDATIDINSDVFEAGMVQFRDNMTAVLRTFERAKVPVYIGTVASNLAGQAPLGDNAAADSAYADATSLYAADPTAARARFIEAKDLDNLRFRAPESVNVIIRELSSRYGATVVDTESAIRQASRTGVEDNDLFTDHLHPTHDGYAILASTFYSVLRDMPELDVNPISFTPPPPDPVTLAAARTSIERLTTGYPFDKDISPDDGNRLFQQTIRRQFSSGWADSLGTLAFVGGQTEAEVLLAGVRAARARADTLNTLLLYRALLPWQPFNVDLQKTAVGFALGSPNYNTEVSELARHAANLSGDIFFYNALGVSLLRAGSLEGAERALAIAESLDQNSVEMLYNSARLHLTRGDTMMARSYFSRYQLTTAQTGSNNADTK